MRMISCTNGHFYDESKHQSCPYCAGGTVENVTKKTQVLDGGVPTKKTKVAGGNATGTGATEIYAKTGGTVPATDGAETVFISTAGKKTEDVNIDAQTNAMLSGWLVITSDEGKGASYSLTFGMNTIGRNPSNHICIDNKDTSISREKHAVIIYDYQNNKFFVKHGEGQFLSYLNDEVLLDSKELHANDRIRVGKTELIFIPLCSENFTWEE